MSRNGTKSRVILSIDSQLSKHEVPEQQSGRHTSVRRWHYFIKIYMDKIIALSALLILSPLLIVVAIFIKLDSKGPIIFRQRRNGLNNKEFYIWKFRTMRVMENGTDVKQAKKNDARITRIGNFLRKSSLDELPQFINVLLGHMSVVGPRPHPVALNEKFIPLIEGYNNRHAMRPGLTGLAQINGHRGPTDTVEQMRLRVESDIEYIDTWSLWRDIKIMLATPYYGLFSKNAF